MSEISQGLEQYAEAAPSPETAKAFDIKEHKGHFFLQVQNEALGLLLNISPRQAPLGPDYEVQYYSDSYEILLSSTDPKGRREDETETLDDEDFPGLDTRSPAFLEEIGANLAQRLTSWSERPQGGSTLEALYPELFETRRLQRVEQSKKYIASLHELEGDEFEESQEFFAAHPEIASTKL